MAGENPLSYRDLFDFTESSDLKAAIRDIKKLKDTYKDFVDQVVGGQLKAISDQQSQLAATARELADATKSLNITTKDGQKALIENAKLTEQLEKANKKLSETTKATKQAEITLGDSVDGLTKKLRDQIKEYNSLSKTADKLRLKELASDIAKTRSEIKQLNDATKITTTTFTAARGSYAALDAETKKMVQDLKQMEGGMNANSRAAKELQKQIFTNTQKLKDFDRAMNQNFRNVGNYSSAFGALGGQLQSLVFTYISLTAAIQVIRNIVRSNSELSDSIADIRRTASLTGAEAEKLVNSLKKLDTRTSLKGLMDIAIIGGRLGIAKENLAGFTDAADKLTQTLGSELGNTEEITTGLGKIINIFSTDKTITGDALLKVGNAIVDLSNKGVASGRFIVDFTQRLAGIAGVAKLSLGSTIGLGAGLEELGTSAEVGGTAVTQLIFKIGTDVPKYAKLAGKSVEEFAATLKKSPVEALIQLAEGLAKNKTGFAEISESFKEAEAKGVRVAGTLAVIGTNGNFLREKIEAANVALLDTNKITEAAALKNETLAASIEKLDAEFTKYTTSGGMASFFKFFVDQLRTSLRGINDIIAGIGQIRKLSDINAPFSRLAARNSILDNFDQSSKVANSAKQEINPIGSDRKIVVESLADLPIGQIKALITKYQTAGQQAADAFNLFKKSIKDGTFVELDDAEKQKFKDVEANYKKLQGILNVVSEAYVKARDKIKKAQPKPVDTIKEDSGNDLTSQAGIRAEITRLSKLPGSADPNSDVAKQIDSLKDKLKELRGTAVPAKDAVQKLQEQLQSLNSELLNGLADGRIDESDKALQQKISSAEQAIKRILKLREDLARGDGKEAFALTPKGEPGDAPSDNGGLSKAQNFIDAEDFADQAQQVTSTYSRLNLDLLNEYKNGTITREEYDKKSTEMAIEESNARYFFEKNRIAALLHNQQQGSREYNRLKEQEADLDEKHAHDQINRLEDIEEKRRDLIKTTLDFLRTNIQPLADELGSGIGSMFTTLTDDLQKFFENGKLTTEDYFLTAGALASGFTQLFVNGSNSRIQSLELEKARSIELAGNNADAKKRIEDRYNKQIAQEKTKQAKAEKLNAMFSIAVNTAAAVVKALPNIPLSIAIGILGAVQLAFVAAKAIPKFKHGRTGGPATLGIVNDGTGPEAIEDKSGKIRIAGGGKETVTYLNEGDKVHTAEQTEKIFGSNRFVDSVLEGTNVVRSHESRKEKLMTDAILKSKLSEKALIKGYKEAIADMPIQQLFIDEKGARTYNKKANQRIHDQNARNTTGGLG